MNWFNVNFLAILVSAIAYMILGSLWYSPALFGKAWMKNSGVDKKKMKAARKGIAKNYLIELVANFIMAYIIALFFSYVRPANVLTGITVGILIWIGFIATTSLSSVLWERKSLRIYILSNAHILIGLMIMTAIISAWM